MKKLMLFEGYISLLNENKKEKKDLNWIHKSIKKPGALHKALGIPKEDSIPMEKINSKERYCIYVNQKVNVVILKQKNNLHTKLWRVMNITIAGLWLE